MSQYESLNWLYFFALSVGPNFTLVLLYAGTRGVGPPTATLDARHNQTQKLIPLSTAHRSRHKSIVPKVVPKGPTPRQSSPDLARALGQRITVPAVEKNPPAKHVFTASVLRAPRKIGAAAGQ